jgi:hypothetical protein
MQKKWVTFVAACLLCAAGSAWSQVPDLAPAHSAMTPSPAPKTANAAPTPALKTTLHPATEAQVREYVQMIGLDKSAHVLLENSANSTQAKAAPYFPASFWDDLRAEYAKTDVTLIYLPVYQHYFSSTEMQALLAFYHSPVGKKILETQPEATREASAALKAQAKQIADATVAKHSDEINAAKAQYQTEHTAPPAK